MSASALVTVSNRDGVYFVEGILDEHSPPVLNDLADRIGKAPQATLDTGGVKRINSLGVRAWVEFMKKLAGKQVGFRRCSPAFVDQLNSISEFRGGAKIESFLAPYVCESSGAVFYEELTVGKDIKKGDFAALNGRPCKVCPKPLVFDDLPERYLLFLDHV